MSLPASKVSEDSHEGVLEQVYTSTGIAEVVEARSSDEEVNMEYAIDIRVRRSSMI